MVKDHTVREETHCHHMGYSFWLPARVLLYASSHRQDNTYHDLCYTSHGALAGTKNSSMGPPHEGSIRRPIAPWANALPLSYVMLHVVYIPELSVNEWAVKPTYFDTVCFGGHRSAYVRHHWSAACRVVSVRCATITGIRTIVCHPTSGLKTAPRRNPPAYISQLLCQLPHALWLRGSALTWTLTKLL